MLFTNNLGYYRAALRYKRFVHQVQQASSQWSASGTGRVAFYVLSAGRSGSTLLRRMLHAHPEISIPPESEDLLVRSLKLYLNAKGDEQQLRTNLRGLIAHLACMDHWRLDNITLERAWNDVSNPTSDFPSFFAAIYQAYAASHKPTATVHGDKTPHMAWHVDLIRAVYPSALIIHIIRNPLDVISSIVAVRGQPAFEAAVQRWTNISRLMRTEQARHGQGFFQVRYEDLVAGPKDHVQALCRFLCVEYHPGMECDLSQDLGDTVLPHHRRTHEPVSSARIGAWRNKLSESQIETVVKRCHDLATHYGYDLRGECRGPRIE